MTLSGTARRFGGMRRTNTGLDVAVAVAMAVIGPYMEAGRRAAR